MAKQYAILVDLVLVLVFATIGRASHAEGLTPNGILSTAWPFLTACLVAWAVMLIRRRDHLGLGAGLFTWFITWAGGLFFRVSSGDTAETPFIIVAGIVLLLFLVGWRLVAGFVTRGRTPTASVADQ